MKKVAFLALTAVFMAGCTNITNQKPNDTMNKEHIQEVALGAQKDEHGCLASTGETWSELKKTCLQIFNEGLRLNPIEVKKGEAVISAFALFNDDQSKVEIFLPSGFEKLNVILPKSSQHIFEAEQFKFNSQNNALFIKGKAVYKGE